MNILVVAAHPDDEVIGMGGTIKKVSKKNNVSLCVLSEGASAQYEDAKMIQVRRDACKESGKILGISEFFFFDFPDMRLDSIPHLEINKELEIVIKKIKPKVVYSTPYNDLNKDHQKVFESCLVATRPLSSSVKKLLCYELPGIVRQPFHAVSYENIAKELPFKIRAFKKYESEVMKFPHHRSIKSIENLAIHRGIECGLSKAEAFELIRDISE